jgi:membrane-associated protease RseP (regulator of RpoE activity)
MIASTDRLQVIAQLRTAVQDAIQVDDYEFLDKGEIALRGRLKGLPEEVYPRMRRQVEQLGYTPYLRPHATQHEVLVVPGVAPKMQANPQINLILFIATIVSTIFTVAILFDENFNLANGLMFGGALMGILTAHEAGHYIVSRIRRVPVTLPYFIPLPAPLSFAGTMGAVIVQREPFENRRTLLEIAAAGPIAGFIVAVPLLALGYLLSDTNVVLPANGEVIYFGDSLLTLLLTTLRFGAPDALVNLHPVGFAAWIGLLITGINLLPAGQLDGGHVVYALLGHRAKYVSYATIAAMAALAFISQTWILWVALLFLFGRHHPPSLNEAVTLKPVHYALILASALIFVLVFIPRPIY